MPSSNTSGISSISKRWKRLPSEIATILKVLLVSKANIKN